MKPQHDLRVDPYARSPYEEQGRQEDKMDMNTERYLAVMLEDLAFRLQAMASDVLHRGLIALGSQESIGETYGRINDTVVGTHRAILALRRGDAAKAEEWLNGIPGWEQ